MRKLRSLLLGTILPLAAGCARVASVEPPAVRPSILLVTLDTTRADSVQPESVGVETPQLAALAARGLRFSQAYTTAPATLPAHTSMFTGRYPAGHGIHENARRLGEQQPLLAEQLGKLGYQTAAFVSGYPLERQFGLARGFQHYDDDFAGGVERPAALTTDRALAFLASAQARPLFAWVHFYDPHEPYQPPPALGERYRDDPYLGEIAGMDQQLGRLVAGFEDRLGRDRLRILVVGDHGEGRGDHGEMLHGNLLYQGVMRVPLLVVGPGLPTDLRSDPVSTRQVFATLLDWAGREGTGSLLRGVSEPEPVLGEAMQPYLQYRWQPQVMAILGSFKVIRAGRLEVYDLAADPMETHDLAGTVEIDRALRTAIQDYPLPLQAAGESTALSIDEEAKNRLASLGYLPSEAGAGAPRQDAPRPVDMSHLFGDLDLGSRRFVAEDYGAAIPIFERLLRQDPGNAMVAVRLAVAHSALGRDSKALDYFKVAQTIDPASLDVRHYLAMHDFRAGRWRQAAPLFESVLTGQPDKLAALESLAAIREREGNVAATIALLERVATLARDPAPSLNKLGELRMAQGDTDAAIRAFERARELQGQLFSHNLELGVLYLASQRLGEARDALDRVPTDHPGYGMALFKRAQVSVLLGESDRAERIRVAYEQGDSRVRELIVRERLFAGLTSPPNRLATP